MILTMQSSVWDKYFGGAIKGEYVRMQIQNVTVSNGHSPYIFTSPLDCYKCGALLVDNSRFYNNTSIEGGAIKIENDTN